MSTFMKYLPVIVTVTATIGAAVFTPMWLASHVVAASVLNVIAQLLHAALPSVFGMGTPTP